MDCSPSAAMDGGSTDDPGQEHSVMSVSNTGSDFSTPSSPSQGSPLCNTYPEFGDDFLEYKVLPLGVPAGKALQHAKNTVRNLFAKHEPLIFKFGYTHNPRWRWYNNIYGYHKDKFNKWTKMVILFEATEPSGPAMLEAALIELFGSTWIEIEDWIFLLLFIARTGFLLYAFRVLSGVKLLFYIIIYNHCYINRPWCLRSQVSRAARMSELAATMCMNHCNPQMTIAAALMLCTDRLNFHHLCHLSKKDRLCRLDHVPKEIKWDRSKQVDLQHHSQLKRVWIAHSQLDVGTEHQCNRSKQCCNASGADQVSVIS